jgi:hypothetical protein
MKSRVLLATLILLLATACNSTFEVGLEHPTDGPAVGGPTITAVLPTLTSPQPSQTVQVATETGAPAQAGVVDTVRIFLIAVDDNGQGGQAVGCGDSVIPVEVQIPATQGVLRAALETLLSIRTQYYGESGLYNALYQSDLQVESASVEAGRATVYLTGTLTMGGECDAPRVQAQLEQTVLQFPDVTEAVIFINGEPLAEVLSLRG